MNESKNILDNQSPVKLLDNFLSGIKDFYFWSSTFQDQKEYKTFSDNVLFVTGYSGDEILSFSGKNFALIFEDDYKKVKILYDDFINNIKENELNLSYRIQKKDNTLIWVEENINAVRNSQGEIVNLNGIVKNVSDYKIKESELLEIITNLEETNKSKDNFISILSHDLRAPFTSILGFCELLINEKDLNRTESLEYLNYIHTSAQNQLQFINYLLDWSRLQTGRIKFDVQRINAQMIIYNCIASFTGDAVRKNIEIKVNVPDSLYIQVDERLFSQVITNLVSNAIKFSNEGQTVELSADIFNDQMAEFIVSDKGKGISENNKSKLFKIENIFSTKGTKGEKGTGLGLPLVKEIIDKLKGEIWAYSKLDEGSEFHFTIPLSSNTILLVNDDDAERNVFEKVIREKFPLFKVIGTENAYSALEIILNRTPSLIITDYEMPLMDGVKFIENIRKGDTKYSIPIIALVETNYDDLKNNLDSLGINLILQKPIDPETLSLKLQSLLK